MSQTLPTVDLRAVAIAEQTAPEGAKLKHVIGMAGVVQRKVDDDRRSREIQARVERDMAAQEECWKRQRDEAIARKAELLKRGELKPPEPAPKPPPEPEWVGYGWPQVTSASGPTMGTAVAFRGGGASYLTNRPRSYLTAGTDYYRSAYDDAMPDLD